MGGVFHAHFIKFLEFMIRLAVPPFRVLLQVLTDLWLLDLRSDLQVWDLGFQIWIRTLDLTSDLELQLYYGLQVWDLGFQVSLN